MTTNVTTEPEFIATGDPLRKRINGVIKINSTLEKPILTEKEERGLVQYIIDMSQLELGGHDIVQIHSLSINCFRNKKFADGLDQ